ncbi:MAG: hypothetical protein KF852_06165 [Saprospiraceae bacterium]|nr:hypothetical protein [Saprospiraceae bacterium]
MLFHSVARSICSVHVIPLLSWILLAVVGSAAQTPAWQFEHLGQEQGLTHNTANYFLTQDSRGFVWVGSLNGFYRYDGLRFWHYLIPKNQEDAYTPDQIIQSGFWEDRVGNLWFSTYNSLHCLRRADGRILNFRAPDGADRSYHVFHLEKNTGRLWLRAGDRVWTFLPESGRWAAQFATQGIRFAVGADKKGAPQYVIACAWLKSPVSVHRKTDSDTWISENYLSPEMEVRSALLHTDSTAWLFARQGLLEFNFRSGQILGHWTQTPGAVPLNTNGGVCWESGQSMIVGTKEDGLLIFDTRRRQWRGQLLPQAGRATSMLNAAPRGLLLSREGQLWIGYESGGLSYSCLSQQGFEELLPENPTHIRAAVQTPDGTLWIASAEGQVWAYKGGNVIQKPAPPRSLVQLASDDAGTLWGLSQQGLYRIKKGASGWEACYEVPVGLVAVFTGIPGRVLLTTQDGIFDVQEQAGQFSMQFAPEFAAHKGFYFKDLHLAGSSRVLIPFESKKIWIATVEGQSLQITSRMDVGGDTHGICLTPDGDSLWLASNTGLLLYTDGRLHRVVDSARNLGGADVTSVFRTSSGHLWLGTLRGLYRYHPATGQLHGFFERDGLSGEQFSHLATWQSKDGRIFLGHQKGMLAFHPDSIRAVSAPPSVHIEALWVNNLPFETPKVIAETDTLYLGYRENTLALELMAIGFHQAEDNTLAYRLRGYDDNWATVANGGFARFTKIPPGQYTLEVLPKSANGETGPAHTLVVWIRPPFWQTWWFKVGSVLAILLLTGGSVGLYYRRQLRRQRALLERQEALHAERNRIAKELHDDMGGSLSSIRFLSEDLLLDDTETAPPELQRISQLAGKALENMRLIIWAMDSDKNTLQDLASRLRSIANELLSDNKITAVLDIPTTGFEAVILGGERRRNIYLIAKEALHNVLKHARATEVRVSLRMEAGHIVLEIEDNGRGLAEGAGQSGGYGMGSMQARARAIGGELELISKPGEGVIVRLSAMP